jgi:replicative DNA helicase
MIELGHPHVNGHSDDFTALFPTNDVVSHVATEPERGSGSPGFNFDFIDTEKFFGETYEFDWLARGILLKGETCVVGGPQKALKTSILIDLAMSLGTGTPFLGRFPVDNPVRVALVSGESGRAVIQANAREIESSRGLPRELRRNIHWSFRLPQLSNAAHMRTMREDIERHGLQVICLDPLYLMLLAGSKGVEASNLYQMGPLLAEVATTCLEAGATPILCHHSVKRRENPNDPMDMEDLAFSGIGQYARQWMLISRREKFDPEGGIHRMHLSYGGSAGHSGDVLLDIETGKLRDDFSGRRWDVTTSTSAESRTAREERQKAEKESMTAARIQESESRSEQTRMANVGKVIEAIRALVAKSELATTSQVASASNLSMSKAKAALTKAVLDGRILKTTCDSPPERKGPRVVEVYRVAH